MRYLYSFLFYLALPFVFLRLLWRSRRLPAYRKRFKERLGFYSVKFDRCLWVHAVSVGETIAAVPLINALKQRYPHLPVVVTTMTPTGAARVNAVFGDSVTHAYLPYDIPGPVSRFLKTFHPVVAIIMETELWPNLLAICKKRHIPVCLANARLSKKSALAYHRIAWLSKGMLNNIDVIAAHGQRDAERFIQLGAPISNVVVTGNIKFDLELPQDLMRRAMKLTELLGKDRFVWVAASTHEGEEEIILAAHQQLRERVPHALLILVPRHPDRFNAVAKLCEQQFNTVRRSQDQICTQDTAVYLGDTMGEMLLMYAVSDVAFVGGSLIKRGGHNILEPAALAKPIITGPSLFNFAEMSEQFVNANALCKVTDASSLAAQLITFSEQSIERISTGARAKCVMDANRGALGKQLALIGHLFAMQRN